MGYGTWGHKESDMYSGFQAVDPKSVGMKSAYPLIWGLASTFKNAIELEKKKKTLVCTTPGKIKYCFVKKGFLLQCISDS